jgi:hypothetical protein
VAVRSPFEVLAEGRSHFRIADLLQLAALIVRQQSTTARLAGQGSQKCQANNAASVK